MGYIREPKNVDLLVAPSVLTEDTKQKIEQAIAQYRKTGQKPADAGTVSQGSVKVSTRIRRKAADTQPNRPIRRKAKI
jgi:hypothetical protein